jgi:hypothetical protein
MYGSLPWLSRNGTLLSHFGAAILRTATGLDESFEVHQGEIDTSACLTLIEEGKGIED